MESHLAPFISNDQGRLNMKKLPPLNTPVYLKVNTMMVGPSINLLCIILPYPTQLLHQYATVEVSMLAVKERSSLSDTWNIDNPVGSFFSANQIKSWKVVPVEDFPLYVGWYYIWPALSKTIKKA